MKERLFNDPKYAAGLGVLGFIVVCLFLSIYLVVGSVFKYQGIDQLSYNQITVQGYGEVEAIPDVATFSFTVDETANTSEEAQNIAATKSNSAIDYLKEQGVSEEDIKTTNFNIYPKYEYRQRVCIAAPCGPGENELIGYQVTNTTSVKVRESERAGEFISKITEMEINNVGSLLFVIDDDKNLSDEAREVAIKDAKQRADSIAKDLGVSLGKVISFSEDGGGERPYYESSDMSQSLKSSVTPDLQSGSTTVNSTVFISYKIK